MKTETLSEEFGILERLIVKGGVPDLDGLREILFDGYLRELLTNWEYLLGLLAMKVRLLHCKERTSGILIDKVYKLDTQKNVIVISDLHGDCHSLWQIIDVEKAWDDSEKVLVFLGDYIDRGPRQLSTLALPLLLKVLYPGRVFLLRGNHEHWIKTDSGYKSIVRGSEDELFVTYWSQHFGESIMTEICELMEDLPVVISLNSCIGLVHAGLPRPTNGVSGYDGIRALADLNSKEILYEMRWSRPEDKEDVIVTGESGFSTARLHFNNFMSQVGWRMLIRGHDPIREGYELLPVYKNRLLTIHSTGEAPTTAGDDLSEDWKSAYSGFIGTYASIVGNTVEVLRVYGQTREERLLKRLVIEENGVVAAE